MKDLNQLTLSIQEKLNMFKNQNNINLLDHAKNSNKQDNNTPQQSVDQNQNKLFYQTIDINNKNNHDFDINNVYSEMSFNSINHQNILSISQPSPIKQTRKPMVKLRASPGRQRAQNSPNKNFETLLNSQIDLVENLASDKKHLEKQQSLLTLEKETLSIELDGLQKVHQAYHNKCEMMNHKNSEVYDTVQKLRVIIQNYKENIMEQDIVAQTEIKEKQLEKWNQVQALNSCRSTFYEERQQENQMLEIQKQEIDLMKKQNEIKDKQLIQLQLERNRKVYYQNDKLKILSQNTKRLDLLKK
eukprot:403339432